MRTLGGRIGLALFVFGLVTLLALGGSLWVALRDLHRDAAIGTLSELTAPYASAVRARIPGALIRPGDGDRDFVDRVRDSAGLVGDELARLGDDPSRLTVVVRADERVAGTTAVRIAYMRWTLDGGDGGTGAAPQPLIDYVGMPLRESLPIVVDLLHEYGLRERIKVIASGKLITPAEAAAARMECSASEVSFLIQ